jgi:transposase
MTKKPQTSKDAAEKVVKNIRRKTRQTYSAEEKIRIVLAACVARKASRCHS